MFDIMERNVSLVENLNRGRQPFKDMDAIYFISPTMEAAERIMGDFITPERAKEIKREDGSPGVAVTRYGRAHLVFTGQVNFLFYMNIQIHYTNWYKNSIIYIKFCE